MEGNERTEVSVYQSLLPPREDQANTIHRREIKQIEQRKRERRKRVQARQRRQEEEREERMMQIMAQNPQLAMMQRASGGASLPMMSGGAGVMPTYAPPPPQADNSGNPYAPRY
jgi:hypothetical protein